MRVSKARRAGVEIAKHGPIAGAHARTGKHGALGSMEYSDRHIALHGFGFWMFRKGEPSCEYVAS